MRWNRPGEGLIAPDVFIPAAEHTSIICDLGQWALRQATAQLAAWAREVPGLDGRVFVAVNISGHHASSPAIVSDVDDALRASGLVELIVVAEGVEVQPTLDTLRELRCDAAQGYLFARPMPAGEAAAWLARASADSLAPA
jgi:EAL domain-containing protein (putative c-di-GMP-specific phosphodiesterase class I)